MTYIALLRGINVGGNNTVSMAKLKVTLTELGLRNVTTYINSGNVIFQDTQRNEKELIQFIEDTIQSHFSLSIKVLVISAQKLHAIEKIIPKTWKNDQTMKCDVLFLWPEIQSQPTLKALPLKEGIDETLTTTGAIICKVERKNATRSGLSKVVATPEYKRMTIRNCNTVRKLVALTQKAPYS